MQVRALPRSPLPYPNLLPADAEPYTTHPVCGRVPGGFRNPLEQRHGRPAATSRAGPALWPVPVKLNGPSGRWRVRCAGSRNRGRAHGPYCHLPPARGGARSEGVRACELCGTRLNCAQPMQSGPKPISAAVRPARRFCCKVSFSSLWAPVSPWNPYINYGTPPSKTELCNRTSDRAAHGPCA